jgi:hypothetical protein
LKNTQNKLITWIKWVKFSILFFIVFASSSVANNVIVVIIDGARYTETFGAEDTFIPFIWNKMRPQATIFTNFYNGGVTKTNPGHATIVTGNLQNIANNGSERPTFPTIFEYFIQQKNVGRNQIISEKRTQIDITPTIADLLSVSAIYATGSSFSDLISQQISYSSFNAKGFDAYNFMAVELDLNTSITDLYVKRANEKDGKYIIIASYEYDQLFKNRRIYFNQSSYSFIDDSVTYGVNYWYTLVALDSGRVQVESEPVFATPTKQEDIPSISDDKSNLADFNLEQNYPNPFNPKTVIEFTIPKTGFVTLQLYNMLGQKVATIIEKELHAGAHKINWTANKLVSGTYIYRLQYGKLQKIKKMILLQ